MSYETNQNNPNEPKTNDLIDDYLDLIRCSRPYCNCGKCISERYSHNSPNFPYEKNLKSSYKNEFDWKRPEDKYLLGNGRKPILKNLGLDDCFKQHLKSSLVSVMKNDYSQSLKLKEEFLMNKLKVENPKSINYIENDINKAKLAIENQDNQSIENSKNNQKISCKQKEYAIYKKINNYNGNNRKELLNYPSRNSNKDKLIYLNKNDDNNSSKNHNTHKDIDGTGFHLNCNKSISLNNSIQIKSDVRLLNPPFIGRSSYELMYPNWKTIRITKEKEKASLVERVPFNGCSSYQENFHPYEKRYYVERPSPIIKSDNLESSGNLINETTNKVSYRPINHKQNVNLNNSVAQISRRTSSLVPAPYNRDSFLSSYERAFMYNNLRGRRTKINLSNWKD